MTDRYRPSDRSPAWPALRRRVLVRAGFRCHWCGRRASEADHVVAIVDGGAALDLRNLVAACRSCNARRGGELHRQARVVRRSRQW
jgi:5-methylcytosine-specific restriction endonuclease McrA